MSSHIYALLVGINHYKSQYIASLKGCINDVMTMAEYLQARVTQPAEKLHIKILQDEAATRQAIIDGFRQHLTQADSNDIALFYFSGHGSQEKVSSEFWHIEPDGWNETLVCWDSRTENIWDLADKEIAILIAEISQTNPHIVMVLDCCHAGGITRDRSSSYSAVRSISPNLKERPVSSFLFASEDIKKPFSDAHKVTNKLNRFPLPQGKYICLAACRDSEEAREHYTLARGAFSYFLTDTLQRYNGKIAYRDLFKRTNALVRSFYPNQSPQIEATNRSYLDRFFLENTIAEIQPYFTVNYDYNYGWAIDGGAIHGVLIGLGDEKTRLAILPLNTQNFRDFSQAMAVAEAIKVFPQFSQINISGEREELDRASTYKAVITTLPLSPLGVYLDGDREGISLVRQALQKASFNSQPSLYITEVSELNLARFDLKASNNQYLISLSGSDRLILDPIVNYNLDTALKVIQSLEHISRWLHILELSNSGSDRIPPDAIQLQMYHQGSEIQDSEICLKYEQNAGNWKPPQIQIKLSNTSSTPLYCTLLSLGERYAAQGLPFVGNSINIRLDSEQSAWVAEGKSISVLIPDYLWQKGITQSQDILKLIVSTNEFDATLLEQDNIEIVSNRCRSNYSQPLNIEIKSTLNRLISKIQTRAIVPYPEPETEIIYDDWITKEIAIAIIKPNITEIKSIVEPVELPLKTTKLEIKQEQSKHINYLAIAAMLVLSLSIITFACLYWKQWQDNQNKKIHKTITYVSLTN